MKAIIMAGGEGQRLRPITCTKPKPMAELLNKPTMQYCVELLKKHGIKDITATLHYIPDSIMAYFKDGEEFGVNMQYSVEEEPMGTAGSVRYALKSQIPEKIIVMSGDALCDINLKSVIESHEKSGANATIVLKRVDDPTEYGVVLKDKKGFVSRFMEKPMIDEVFSDYVNTGIYILNREAIELIPDKGVFDFSKDLFPLMLKNNMKILGLESDCYWCDIGDIREFVNAQTDLMMDKCNIDIPFSKGDGIYIEDGAQISNEAVLVPPCYIGKGAEIGENVIIGPETVIGRNSKIGRNSSIKHSLLMKNVRIRENCEIRGAVICEGAVIGSRNSIFEYAVIGANTKTREYVTIDNGVLVWPQKELEGRCTYSENIVWQKEKGKVRGKITVGYSDNEFTPAHSSVLGQAIASVLNDSGNIAIATDGTQQSTMIKYALISGIISQGVDVLDLGYTGRSQFEFTIRNLSLDGGVYVKLNTDEPYKVELSICGKYGVDVSANEMKKIEREMERGEKKPITTQRLGIIEKYEGSTRTYEAHLLKNVYVPQAAKEETVIFAGKDELFDSISRLLMQKGVLVKQLASDKKDMLHAAMEKAGAQLGIYADDNNEVKEVLFDGHSLSNEMLNAVFMLDRIRSDGIKKMIVPADMANEYIAMLCENGAAVEKVKADRSCMIKTMCKEGVYLPELFESEGRILKIVSLMLKNKLKMYIDTLPRIFKSEAETNCSWKEIGKVFRNLAGNEQDEKIELIDGVKIRCDNGWVLIKPNNLLTSCRIVAGSFGQEYAEELCSLYKQRVFDILKQ